MPEQRPHPQALADGGAHPPWSSPPYPCWLAQAPAGAEESGAAVGVQLEDSGREGGSGKPGAGRDFSHPPGTSILEPGFGWGWGRLEGTGVRWRLALFSAPGGSPGLWPGRGEQSWPSPDS